MKKLFLLSLMALMTMTMMSCVGANYGEGSLENTTPTQVTEISQVTTMEPFDVVDITGAFRVIYEQGTEYNVRVEASEQAFKEMTVYVKDRELCIHKSVYKPTARLGNVKVYVSSPELKKIDVSDAGLFAADTINLGTNPRVFVMGSSWVLLSTVTNQGKAIFSVDGSGNIEVGNLKTDGAVADIDGSGKIILGALECNSMRAGINGSGEINCDNINADDVHANISGSGNVNLKGTVKNVTKDITGTGKVNITEATSSDSINRIIQYEISPYFKK